MGTLCRKAVWGAALLFWLMTPAMRAAASDGKSGKTYGLLEGGSSSSGGPQRVIVRTRTGAKEAVKRTLRNHGEDVLGDHSLVDAVSARVHPENLAALAADPNIRSISPDAIVSALASGSQYGDSSSTWSWGATSSTYSSVRLKALLGLDGRYTGTGVGVALIDSGLAPSFDFFGRIAGFYDFSGGRPGVASFPFDDYGHGTHIAGLIGSNGVTSSGRYEGIAPGVRFLALKVLDRRGVGYTSDVIRALEFAVANKQRYNLKIVNLSLGHPIYESAATDPLVQAVEAAVRAGLVVVVSGGNCGVSPAGKTG
jgi:serine protease AprX